MRTREWLVAATVAAMMAPAASTAASTAVFKCRGADGALTYQQLACGRAPMHGWAWQRR